MFNPNASVDPSQTAKRSMQSTDEPPSPPSERPAKSARTESPSEQSVDVYGETNLTLQKQADQYASSRSTSPEIALPSKTNIKPQSTKVHAEAIRANGSVASFATLLGQGPGDIEQDEIGELGSNLNGFASTANGKDINGLKISELVRAFAIERYEGKYDIAIAGMVNGALSEANSEKLIEKLDQGQSVGIMYTRRDADSQHSIPIVLTLDKSTSTPSLSAIWSDSLDGPEVDDVNNARASLETIASSWNVPLSNQTNGLPSGRQSDAESCHADALVTLKEILVAQKETPNFTPPDLSNPPAAVLKVAQRTGFLDTVPIDHRAEYRQKRNKNLAQHRNDHSVDVTVAHDGGTSQTTFNIFLVAKSFQFAEATMQWLSMIPENKRSEVMEDLEMRHFFEPVTDEASAASNSQRSDGSSQEDTKPKANT